MNILIAYYSYSGNTETMAQEIQNQVGGDLFIIERKEEYNDLYTEAEEEINDNERPKLSNTVENITQYDVIFIGFPIWWGVAPRVVNTFIENSDLKDKDLIVFATSGGSGLEYAVNDLRKRYPGLNIRSGRLVKGKVTEDMA